MDNDKSPSAIAQELKQIAARLLELFPGDESVQLDARRLSGPSISIHRFPSYKDAVEFVRTLGIRTWEKQVHDPESPWSYIYGNFDGIDIGCFAGGLPPGCRKVKKVERVPKTQTVETGDFIEIEREAIECGQEHPAAIVEQAAEAIV